MGYHVAVGGGLEAGGVTGRNRMWTGRDGGLVNSGGLSRHQPKILRRAVMASICSFQDISGASWRACEISLRLWVTRSLSVILGVVME